MDRSGKLLPPGTFQNDHVIHLKVYVVNWFVCVLVYEHLSVRDAGIRLMTSLYLCPGPVLTTTQVRPYNLGLCECKK